MRATSENGWGSGRSEPDNQLGRTGRVALERFVGQDRAVNIVTTLCRASAMRGTMPGHILLHGPPGTGKTTIAKIVANELYATLINANGGGISSVKDLLPFVYNIGPRTIFFIDEVHRLNKRVSEFLYTIVENFQLVLTDGESRVIERQLPKFTFIGATTEIGSVPKPLRDRCQHHIELTLYDENSLAQIVLPIVQDEVAARKIAVASKGTPRIAINLAKWCVDCRAVHGYNVEESLKLKGVRPNGFTDLDVKYLNTVASNGPIGLKTLAAMLAVDESTITDYVEPYMIYKGYIKLTPNGRVICGTENRTNEDL